MKGSFRIIGALFLTLCFFAGLFALFFLMHEYRMIGRMLGIAGAVMTFTLIFAIMYFGPMGDKKT